MTKILFTGTTSSGKTTLLRHFKANSRVGVTVIDEVARPILENHPELLKSPQLQSIIFAEQTRLEKEAAAAGAGVILCDRGSVDVLAHAKLFGQELLPEWRTWSQQEYDQIYLLDQKDIRFQRTPLQQHLEEQDWGKFRMDLEAQLHLTLAECGLAYTILSGSVEHRIAQVEEKIWQSLWEAERRHQKE